MLHAENTGDGTRAANTPLVAGSGLFVYKMTLIFKKNKFIYFTYLFLAALGLCCCARAFSSCGEWRLLFLAVVRASHCGVLSLLQSMGSRRVGFSSCVMRALERRLSSCGAWAQVLRGMWDLPGPGPEPVSPALASRFLTTVPLRKP